MNTEERIKKIKASWFYSEPLLFSAISTHLILNNENLSVPFRTGALRIEYSNLLCQKLNDKLLEEALKIEVFRILLFHPYSRRPANCKGGVLLLASDITINQLYKSEYKTAGVEYFIFQSKRFKNLKYPLGKKWAQTDEEKFFLKNLQFDEKTQNLTTIDDLTFEQWYKKILFLIQETSIAGSENAGSTENLENFSIPGDEETELWEENTEAQNKIQNQILKAQIENGFGSIGGKLTRKLEENTDFSFDYRRALGQFRQNIASNVRNLTRMRPSRRFGFLQMGSRYEKKANVLIAVDVSGSITDESFEHFYKAIKNFFFLGIIEKIDLIFFDVNLKNSTPIKFTKNIDLTQIEGRGGTNFQVPIDFFAQKTALYSGMIIFTDGEGPIPKLLKPLNILWILDNRLSYEKSKGWINSLPKNKATFLPIN